MADEFSVHISGIEETLAMMAQAPRNITKHAFGKALAAAAVPVYNALNSHTPVMVDGSVKHDPPPGALKAHLFTDIEIDQNGKGGDAAVGYGKLGYVARMVEYGHRSVAHGATWNDRKNNYKGKLLGAPVPPKPFMRTAAAESGEASIEAFGESLAQSFREGIPGVKVS